MRAILFQMDCGADIVVTSPNEAKVHLVVEVKLKDVPEGGGVRQLRHYMVRTGAPAGLFVTQSTVTILRDTFRSGTDESVQTVETISTTQIPELQRFAAGARVDAFAFEEAVQDWLVQLRRRLVEGSASGVDPLLAEHVMPALAAGEIRAGGPRYMSKVAS